MPQGIPQQSSTSEKIRRIILRPPQGTLKLFIREDPVSRELSGSFRISVFLSRKGTNRLRAKMGFKFLGYSRFLQRHFDKSLSLFTTESKPKSSVEFEKSFPGR